MSTQRPPVPSQAVTGDCDASESEWIIIPRCISYNHQFHPISSGRKMFAWCTDCGTRIAFGKKGYAAGASTLEEAAERCGWNSDVLSAIVRVAGYKQLYTQHYVNQGQTLVDAARPIAVHKSQFPATSFTDVLTYDIEELLVPIKMV